MYQTDYSSLVPPKLPPAWPKGLLTFTFFVFLFIIGGTFGIQWYNQIKINELKALNKNIDNIRNNFSKEDEQKIYLFDKKLNVLGNLLSNHIKFSKVIFFLEKNTHPQIYYTNLSFDTNSNILKLEGVAQNQDVLSEAINTFANNSTDIQTVILRNIKINSNKTVTFDLELIIHSQLLK